MKISARPFFSIVTICYNSEKTILDTIKSVKSQNIEDIEYILVDGASSDNTLEIINQENNGNFIIISEKDRGISHAFNKGVSKATGKYILFINSDDYLLENSLPDCKSFLSQNPNFDVICCHMLVSNKGKLRSIESKPDQLLKAMSVAHPATIVKREVFETVGLFSEQYKVAMDYDFLLRCKLKKINFTVYNYYLTLMREGGISGKQFIEGKKEVHQIKSNYNLKQPPLFIFISSNIIRHHLGIFLSSIFPNSIYKKLRSLRYIIN